MKKTIQRDIAKAVGCGQSYVSQVINGAKKLNREASEHWASVTNTKPELWMYGTAKEIKAAIRFVKIKPAEDQRCSGDA